jgi:hypothetical protein
MVIRAVIIGALALASLAAIAQTRPQSAPGFETVEIRRSIAASADQTGALGRPVEAKPADETLPAPPVAPLAAPRAPVERKVRVIVPSPYASSLD